MLCKVWLFACRWGVQCTWWEDEGIKATERALGDREVLTSHCPIPVLLPKLRELYPEKEIQSTFWVFIASISRLEVGHRQTCRPCWEFKNLSEHSRALSSHAF